MKKSTLAAFLLALLFASCDRSNPAPPAAVAPPPPAPAVTAPPSAPLTPTAALTQKLIGTTWTISTNKIKFGSDSRAEYVNNADQPAHWFATSDHTALIEHSNGWIDYLDFNSDLTSYKASHAKLEAADWGGGKRADN